MRRNQKKRLSPVTVGLSLIVVMLVAVFLAFNGEIPGRPHYEVKAAFKSANNIAKNSPVRIAGVNVGKVVEIDSVDGNAQASMVTMRIEDAGLPIHADAVMRIRPRIFLEGNFFVDIEPGSPSAPVIDDGDTIPINQTAAPVQLDQVLTSLQSDTRGNLQKLLGSLSTGLAGKGARGFNRSIDFWEDAYRDSALVNDATLGRNDGDLSGYIKNAGAVAAALDRNGPVLRDLITNFNRTAAAFAIKDDELRAGLRELPRTLNAGLPALASLNRAFPPVRAFVVDARPATRSSGPTIDASLPFLRQLRRLVSEPEGRGLTRELRATVPDLAALTARSVPLSRQTRLASSCQNEVILPWSKDTIDDPNFPATGPVFEDSLKVFPGLAGESRTGDANGQWFRVLVSAGNFAYVQPNGDLMLTGAPLVGANPPKPAGRPPLRPSVPCETQQQPDLRTVVAAPPPALKLAVPASRQADFVKKQLTAVEWLRGQIKQNASGPKLKVSTDALTLEDLEKIRRNPK